MDPTAASSAKQRIVILGGGFAGAYCAKTLERFREANYEVGLIDRHNYFVFYPLLIEAGTAKIEPRHTVVPLRPFLKRTRFLSGEIVGLDTSARKGSYHTPMREGVRELEYDHLVVALGSRTRMPDIPGLRERAFQLKPLADATALRDHAIQTLELSDSSTSSAEKTARVKTLVVAGYHQKANRIAFLPSPPFGLLSYSNPVNDF